MKESLQNSPFLLRLTHLLCGNARLCGVVEIPRDDLHLFHTFLWDTIWHFGILPFFLSWIHYRLIGYSVCWSTAGMWHEPQRLSFLFLTPCCRLICPLRILYKIELPFPMHLPYYWKITLGGLKGPYGTPKVGCMQEHPTCCTKAPARFCLFLKQVAHSKQWWGSRELWVTAQTHSFPQTQFHCLQPKWCPFFKQVLSLGEPVIHANSLVARPPCQWALNMGFHWSSYIQ